jgi:membrane complex biogenesis BtpA family protein
MVHLRALPGTPRAEINASEISRIAAEEARVLIDAGFDALIVENMHDAPYVHAGVDGRGHPPETVAATTRCALAVRKEVGGKLPIGVQVLSGGNREALAIALACELEFIRCENFVFSHVADEGLLARAEAGPLLRYRRSIGAERVRVFCDLKKKHASHALTADVSLADAAHAAEFFGADGLIVTGIATGRAASPQDVAEVREASKLPVLVGSGVTPENAGELFDAGADGLIVGSSIKRGGLWSNPIDPKRCRALVKACKG